MLTSETVTGKHPFVGRGSEVLSALTAAVNMFGMAATTKEFSEKLLKWQADVEGE